MKLSKIIIFFTIVPSLVVIPETLVPYVTSYVIFICCVAKNFLSKKG